MGTACSYTMSCRLALVARIYYLPPSNATIISGESFSLAFYGVAFTLFFLYRNSHFMQSESLND